MDLRAIATLAGRRRLVDLRFRPGLQLKLPALLLAVTFTFSLLFVAHANEAYGKLLEAGLDDVFLRALGQEIRSDFVVVSAAIAVAYAVAVIGICLAGTHRILGPIVALRRHLEDIKRGDYSTSIQLRAGHPLSGVAMDLNEVSRILQRSMELDLDEDEEVSASPAKIQLLGPQENAVDRLLSVFPETFDENELNAVVDSIAS